MDTSATDAKNRFGFFCGQAKTEPVIVMKDGRPDTVILGYEKYQALRTAADSMSYEQRRAAFEETYKDWIRIQNEDFEKNGLWCDGIVAWQQE